MDSIAISKEEDMARLQSIAFLLLSKLLRSKVLKFFNLIFNLFFQRDVLNAACEWANKSGDNLLLLWAKSG